VTKGQTKVDHAMFHKTLYLAVKHIQKEPSVNLHRGLKNPEAYSRLVDGECHGLSEFLETAVSMNLVESQNGRYCFLPKLCQEHGFDVIRLENLVAVYANEVAPISGVTRSVERAIEEAPALDDQVLAGLRFDDELRAYAWDKQYFSKPRYKEINEQEAATESGEPFLFLPEGRKELGVVLVHGFLASPAEVRPFGEKLNALGYPVIGVRLKGHGTSPWDLRERNWQDWLGSVRRGYAVMSAFARRICLVGFSTGGALSLRLAADCPEWLAGVAAISVPMKLRDRNMIFVPLVHGANQLVRWVSSSEGIVPFRRRDSEHPNINYRNVPIRSLYELRRMVDGLEERLPDVKCPVTLIQGTDDPIVDPEGAELIHKKLRTSQKKLFTVPSTRHGILYENIGDTQEMVISFLATLSSSDRPDRAAISDSLLVTDRLIKGSVA
jgi:esterase/lipase